MFLLKRILAIHSVTLKLLRRFVMAKCNVLFAQLDLVIIFHHFMEKGDSSALNGRCWGPKTAPWGMLV